MVRAGSVDGWTIRSRYGSSPASRYSMPRHDRVSGQPGPYWVTFAGGISRRPWSLRCDGCCCATSRTTGDLARALLDVPLHLRAQSSPSPVYRTAASPSFGPRPPTTSSPWPTGKPLQKRTTSTQHCGRPRPRAPAVKKLGTNRGRLPPQNFSTVVRDLGSIPGLA
jgi:hypothetical protein